MSNNQKNLTEKESQFLQLAVIEQKYYTEIEHLMNVERKQLSRWWEELKEERVKLSKIRQLWKKKCPNIEFKQFHNWYTSTSRNCHYCGIDEIKINNLIQNEKINTKRLKTRGRSLEIERRKPDESYDKTTNLVFSCYWCNNAKTDEFSETEFKKIGICISEIWENRLSK